MSADAKRVIIGTDSKDTVGVYELNPDTDTWTIVGDFIKVGDGEDKFGHCHDIWRWNQDSHRRSVYGFAGCTLERR